MRANFSEKAFDINGVVTADFPDYCHFFTHRPRYAWSYLQRYTDWTRVTVYDRDSNEYYGWEDGLWFDREPQRAPFNGATFDTYGKVDIFLASGRWYYSMFPRAAWKWLQSKEWAAITLTTSAGEVYYFGR